jgi:Na+-transporting NADH:ubiquinone oxidoreductase subunit C
MEVVAPFDVNLKEEVAKIEEIKKLESQTRERRTSPFRDYLSGVINFKSVDKKKISNEIKTVRTERQLPVFVCEKEGEKYYIFPLRGKGLWGPIWGYISLESDMNTVYGAVFDHKSETPGLGAEIKESWFENNFNGKKIFEEGRFVGIDVVKGGADPGDNYAVDAISGGTITSKGLEDMIYDNLSAYDTFFETQRN